MVVDSHYNKGTPHPHGCDEVRMLDNRIVRLEKEQAPLKATIASQKEQIKTAREAVKGECYGDPCPRVPRDGWLLCPPCKVNIALSCPECGGKPCTLANHERCEPCPSCGSGT